jgi:hypothetical protein
MKELLQSFGNALSLSDSSLDERAPFRPASFGAATSAYQIEGGPTPTARAVRLGSVTRRPPRPSGAHRRRGV